MDSSILAAALAVLLAYLLGSVNGSLALGKLRGGVDIRKLGSGNPGGTNALRTMGPAFALAVVVIDTAKGWIAAAWLPHWIGAGPAGPALCGFAAVLGHVFPMFHGFRGGKGGATLVGALLALSPALLGIVMIAWFVCVMLFGFVGLATSVAALSTLPAVWALELQPQVPLIAFAAAAGLLIAWAHRSNLRRMLAGTEPRARRLWLVGRVLRSQHQGDGGHRK